MELQQVAMSEAGAAQQVHCFRLLAEKEEQHRKDRKERQEAGEFGPEEEMVGVKIYVKMCLILSHPAPSSQGWRGKTA